MEALAPPVEPHLHVSEKYAAELADTLLKLVNINDVQAIETTSDKEEQELNRNGASKGPSNQNRLSRYVSFPSPRKMVSHSSSFDEDNEGPALALENLSPQEQVPLKLKSAIKGSREKEGASPRKMKVTWAPDVYDPLPTSLSHSVKRGSRQQKLSKKDKKRGKRGHKGKDFSRGGSSSSSSSSSSKDSSKGAHGKDKKKKPLTTGSSSMGYKLLDDGNDLALISKDKVDNFGFGVPDSSCGSSISSFFRVSLSKAQYPVAEAL